MRQCFVVAQAHRQSGGIPRGQHLEALLKSGVAHADDGVLEVGALAGLGQLLFQKVDDEVDALLVGQPRDRSQQRGL